MKAQRTSYSWGQQVGKHKRRKKEFNNWNIDFFDLILYTSWEDDVKFLSYVSVLVADLLIYIPAVVLYCLYLIDGSAKKKVKHLFWCFLDEHQWLQSNLQLKALLFVMIVPYDVSTGNYSKGTTSKTFIYWRIFIVCPLIFDYYCTEAVNFLVTLRQIFFSLGFHTALLSSLSGAHPHRLRTFSVSFLYRCT